MKTTSLRRNFAVLSILIILGAFLTSGQVTAAISDDALLNALPKDCIFCLRINKFNESLGKLDQYMAGAIPSPVGLGMLVNLQLVAITGDPMMSGINVGGDFALFAIPPQADQATPSAGMLIPVKNYSEFVKTNSNCSSIEGGLTLLSSADSPIGNILLAPVGNTYALAVPEMDTAAMGYLQKALSNTAKMSQRLSAAQVKEATSAPAWVFVNLSDLYDKYSQQALAMMEMAKMEIPENTGTAELIDFELKLLTEMFTSFIGEADSITMALRPEPTLLSLDTALRAKDGSSFADMLVSDGNAADYTLAGYLDNSNAINGMMKMNQTFIKQFYDKMFDIMATSSGDSDLKDKTDKMKAVMHQSLEAMGDEVSFSYSYASGQPPFLMQEVVTVDDSAAMKALMNDSLTMANDLYKSMGIPASLSYEPGVSDYKGVSIDAVKISVEETNDPDNPIQQQIEQMYGGGFMYHIAQTPNRMYIVLGPDSEEKLKSLIDQSTANPAPEDITTAMNALENTPYTDFVLSVNIIKLIQGVGGMIQTLGAEAPVEAGIIGSLTQDLDIESQSTLVIGGDITNGQMAVRVALPKQHLIEIIATALQLQQKLMAATQASMDNFDNMEMVTPLEETPEVDLTAWIGKPAPELRLVDLEGNVNRVSRLKGKKVLLDFWGTWSPPCEKTIPELVQLRTDTNTSELVIFGLSDEPVDRLNEFAKEQKMNYPVVAYNESLPEPYGEVTVLPTLFLIDSKGIIRNVLYNYHPIDELKSLLDELE